MKKSDTNPAAEAANANLLDGAQELILATANVAGEKVEQARQKLKAAVEKGKAAWQVAQDKTIASAKATDVVIRENPYKSLAVCLGVGVLIGYLLRRKD